MVHVRLRRVGEGRGSKVGGPAECVECVLKVAPFALGDEDFAQRGAQKGVKDQIKSICLYYFCLETSSFCGFLVDKKDGNKVGVIV